MPVNAFGNVVLTLDELIEQLQKVKQDHRAGNAPVWAGNIGPIKSPVAGVTVGKYGVELKFVEG